MRFLPAFGLLAVLAVSLRADERVLVARFEARAAQEVVTSAPVPASVVTVHRSPVGIGPLGEFIEVEVVRRGSSSTLRLSSGAAAKVLDVLDSVRWPKADVSRHLRELLAKPGAARRGIVWMGGRAPVTKVDLEVGGQSVRFEAADVMGALYAHSDDAIDAEVLKVVDACSEAIGYAQLAPN